MTAHLVLRFDAPLMSFGGAAIDAHRVTDAFPGRSLLCGLVANALGIDHAEFDRLQRLQERIVHGARRDRGGEPLIDFHTVDLSHDHLSVPGWTTAGLVSVREGGSASTGTHIRQRHYLADAVFTVVMTLRPAEESPTLDDVERALRHPVRPLFLGRKCALPAAPILVGRVDAADVRDALESAPGIGPRGDADRLTGWWPAADLADQPDVRLMPVHDERDWANQIHAGRRFVRQGTLVNPEARDARRDA